MKQVSTHEIDYRLYEDQFSRTAQAQKRTLPWIFRVLRRFEINRIQRVSELLPPGKHRVLEIGCGDGEFLFINRKRWKSIIGNDVVKDLLRAAKSRAYSVPAEFSSVDYARKIVPPPKPRVDLVVNICTLQLMYDLDLVFDNVAAALKPGGYFIFEVPNAVAFWRRAYFLFGRLPRTSLFTNGWDGGVLHIFSKYDLEMFCQHKGFEVEQVRCAGIFATWREWWVDLLGGDLIFVCRKKR